MKKLVILCLAFILLVPPQVVNAATIYPEIGAKASIVIDQYTGEIYFEKNTSERRSGASLNKIMTALLVFEAAESGQVTWSSQVPISEYARNYYHWAKTPFKESHSLEELTHLLLIESNNQAAIAIAEYLGHGSIDHFVFMMNSRAKEMGIEAFYRDPVGLVPSSLTAQSQAQLVQYFVNQYPQVLEITKQNSYTFEGSKRIATNKFLTSFSYFGTFLGFKTGTTKSAGQCLIAYEQLANKNLISVVLGSSGPEGRYIDSMKVLSFSKEILEGKPIFYSGNSSSWSREAMEESIKGGFNTMFAQGFNRFDGKDTISRAEFISMLALLMDLEPHKDPSYFQDLDPSSWYSPYIEASYKAGLVKGTSQGRFTPNRPLSREQMALMLQNALNLKRKSSSPKFYDMNHIGPVYLSAVKRMAEHQVMKGTDQGYFHPQDQTTREQATQTLYNIQENIIKK